MTPGDGAWRALSPEDLAREYSPSSMVDSMDAELDVYAAASTAARSRHPHAEHAYGPGARQRLDVFHPGGDSLPGPVPVLVFVHGGYWQAESKERACGAAPDVLAAGAAYVAVEYTLAPVASVAEIVAECGAALGWLVAHAAELGIDPARIHLAGSSAGAHLAALLTLGDDALPGATIRSATLLSGVYDLRPLVPTYVNDPLGLDEPTAWHLSPLSRIRASDAALVVSWAECETAEFRRQSRALTTAWRALGNRVDVVPDVPGRNHFDLPLDLADPATALGRAVRRLLHG
ncbi:alpha/beta hydrolase [Nocardioides carbamazepini]|uniref:alpha/beta hydrolase n=1 Tax=Nocardioides carbamazepini TaxID=2854259 RepID=UPI00214A8441|nr:alpha/beta hydrolase [Nocardioides carbamazepini]MCR1784965.1 alpha/beta hydrolase [Nocardioides carbamazepini]